jgi:hypothetical protein
MKLARSLALLTAILPVAPLFAQTPRDKAVLAPIQSLFAAMAQRNPAALQAAFLPGATLVSIHDGKPTQLTAEAFAERIAKAAPPHH